MKKHKMEIAALTLILGVLCYAFYDSNIKGSEQNIVLTNELFTMSEIKNKEDITMEMLSIPGEELKKEQVKKKEEEKNIVEEEIEQADQELISLENKAYSMSLAVVEESIPYNEIISNQVVNYALKFVGYPYVYGGNSLTNGTKELPYLISPHPASELVIYDNCSSDILSNSANLFLMPIKV